MHTNILCVSCNFKAYSSYHSCKWQRPRCIMIKSSLTNNIVYNHGWQALREKTVGKLAIYIYGVTGIYQRKLGLRTRFLFNMCLNHWGLVTPYGVRELGEHWFRWWRVAWRHQAITWTNVHLSSVRSCGIHLRILWLWEDLKIPIRKAILKTTFLKSH